ncbi:MAG TPA: xanthine dehydrogenase family protein molybdopterin-binding subunit [Alphaproteobacteria bacterium]|nr:xanthine dehydrogenase family protein molybdopterin-binding subunit [Alphaproteobacteria bacterium]
MGEYALGQAVPRSEDPRLLRGAGCYIDDIVLPRMAHAAVLRSPHAHANIRSLDVKEALAAPGVLAVLTHEDWKASGWRDIPSGGDYKRRDGSPMFVPPSPALVKDRVRRVGDPVAFVVAETAVQAMDTAELIAVDYEPLPAVTAATEALKPGAPAVWDDLPDNTCFVWEKGDKAAVEAAFAAAKHVARHTFVINRVAPTAMETRGCVADYSAADQSYTLHTCLQGAHPFRSQMARLMKVPESKVRIVSGDIGGSFGMKSAIFNEAPLALLASKMLGRPVKWVSSRAEAFLSDSHGRDNVVEVGLALDANGKFLALRVDSIANLGAFLMQGTVNPPVNNIGSIAGVYTLPAIYANVVAAFTHTTPTRPYRGAGRPEAAFMIERIVDLAADVTGIDPAELRRKNAIPPSAMPYKTALTFVYDCGEFEQTMTEALDLADYDGFERRRAESRTRGKLRGIGISNTIEKAGSPGLEGAEVRFDRSGTVSILAGSVTTGQGHETVFKQIVADRFGLRPDEITYVFGDTDKVPFGHGSGGSRTSSMGGSAVYTATERVVEKATKIAAHLFGVAPDAVKLKDGVFSTPSKNETFTIKDIAKESLKPKSLPDGMEPGLMASVVYASKAGNYPNGCHICEVEIDEDTGRVQLVGYKVVDDVGTVMNPLLLEGQVRGGIAQGMGQILMEDLRYDPDSGQLLTGSLMDYAMPHATDMCRVEVRCHPVPTKTNPLGVKGVGEAGTVGSLPAVANAVIDALSVYGIRHIDMPATPERVWRAIQQAKNDGARA